MDDRFNNIEISTGGTCEWLLRHKEWKQWMSTDRGFLWIKGKPGSGKSTLLRHALQRQGAIKRKKKDLVLSFFFHGRGDELQRNPIGLFRSLLHQALTEMPGALQKLVATFEQRSSGIGRPGEKWEWKLDELRKFFQWSILEVLKTRRVLIFVDALDECGGDCARGIIRHFKDLLQGPSTRSQFRICFTCRHYPIQDWDGGFEICAEQENTRDISTYVQAQLSGFEDRLTFDLSGWITTRSHGLFIWARLVVDCVLDLELPDDPRTAELTIRQAIDSTPQDLDDLFLKLTSGMEESSGSLKLIQWVHCAQRPLSLDELRVAMVLDPNHLETFYYDIHEGSSGYKTRTSVMERRVKALSHGLAETVPSSGTMVVQFIHQSVNDFFDGGGFPTVGPGADIANAHYQLARICIRYLTMPEIDRSTPRYPVGPARCLGAWDFLDYATSFWIKHAQISQAKGACHPHLLYDFGWPSTDFASALGLARRLLDPSIVGCVPEGAQLAHIAARYDLKMPLQMLIAREDRAAIDARDVLGRTPLLYAAERGHEAAVKTLL